MIIRNKLDIAFGPFASSMGFFLLIGGIVATYFSLYGILIVIIGAFISFTSTSTLIDSEKKKIKFSNNLFGIFPSGKWIDIQPGMKLGLKKSHKGYRAYIRGTQPVDIHINDFRIYLYGRDNKPIIPVKKVAGYDSSKAELIEMGNVLGLEII
jgi:hypothetical protein